MGNLFLLNIFLTKPQQLTNNFYLLIFQSPKSPKMSAAKRRRPEKNASPLMVKFMKHLIEQERHFIASTSTYSCQPSEYQLKVLQEESDNRGTRFRFWWLKPRGAIGNYAANRNYPSTAGFRIHNQCSLKGVIMAPGEPGFAICEADWRKNAELEDTRCKDITRFKDMRKVILQMEFKMEFKLSCDTMGVILEFAGMEHILRGWLHAFDCL